MSEEKKIWRLETLAANYFSFRPDSLGFFDHKFQCKTLSDNWKIPPSEVIGKSKPAADFVSWMRMAPIISLKAKKFIEEISKSEVEFLPFHNFKKKEYFVLNVLRQEDYLDLNKSDFEEVNERFVFRSDFLDIAPPLFKCPGHWSEIFVNNAFAKKLVESGLSGAALSDPGEPVFKSLLGNLEINRYPGLS